MRLSPDGRRLVFVAGLGSHPVAPMVTLVLEDGRSVPLEPGHSPRWESPTVALWSPQGDWSIRAVHAVAPFEFDTENLPAGNTLAAGGGVFAVHRTDPRRVLISTGRVITGASDPAISDDGRWIAYIRPDQPRDGVSTLWVERVDGSIQPRQLGEPGAPLSPRFGGTTLAWEIGRGLIAACADVSNPAVPATAFALPSAWKLYKPVPVWVSGRGELLLLFIADDGARGHVRLASWTSLKLGEPRGYVLGVSTGAGYDHDARPVDATSQVRVQWLDPVGLLDGLTQDLTAPRAILAPPVKPEPPPPPPDDSFDLVPTGTLVQDAIATLIGRNPVHDANGIICIHKNTFPEAEWRRVVLVSERWALLHWADASRVPGDPGWWTDPAAILCFDEFRSGEIVKLEGAQIIDMRPGVPPNRWRQSVRMCGLKGGGVFYETDPRFPGQYTDMSKRGTPQWAPAGYEKQWTLRDGRSKWQYIVTPLTAKGVVPWGDPSLDVVIQETPPTAPQPPGPPLPFVPCPRPLVKEVLVSDKTHTLADIDRVLSDDVPEDLFLGALVRYRNEVCLERDRVAVDPILAGIGSAMGRPLTDEQRAVVTRDALGQINVGDIVTGGALLYFSRGFSRERNRARFRGASQVDAAVAGFIGAAGDYRRAVGIESQRPPAGAFAGPIGVAGRDFVTP